MRTVSVLAPLPAEVRAVDRGGHVELHIGGAVAARLDPAGYRQLLFALLAMGAAGHVAAADTTPDARVLPFPTRPVARGRSA